MSYFNTKKTFRWLTYYLCPLFLQKFKEVKSAAIFKYILFTIGLALLIGAFYIYLDKNTFLERAVTTEGTVVGSFKSTNNLNIYYHPIISFKTKKGEQIKFVPSYNSGNPINEKSFEIIYDPANPQEANIKKYTSEFGLPIFMSSFGFLFFIMLLVFHFGQKKAKYIFENGTRIITQFDSVKRTRTHIITGKLLYQICTTYQDPNTNNVRVFKSAKILIDPTGFIKSKNIIVILHPQNQKKYLMDISFLNS